MSPFSLFLVVRCVRGCVRASGYWCVVAGGKEEVLYLPRLVGPAQALTNVEMKPRLAMLGGTPETFRYYLHPRHLL